jgi:hypothetical protein
VIKKLKFFRQVERRRPAHRGWEPVSILELQRQFQAAIAAADWHAAEQVIVQIDAHQLDSAINTSQMRVRVLGKTAEFRELISLVERTNLLTVPLADKVRTAILNAYAALELHADETAGHFEKASQTYRFRLHPRLAESIVSLRNLETLPLQRLAAYRAWADADREGLALSELPANDPVIRFLRADLPPEPQRAEPSSPQADRSPVTDVADLGTATNWSSLPAILKSGDANYLTDFLKGRCTLAALADAEQREACAKALRDLFSDQSLDKQESARRLRERVLLKVIDVAVCDTAFPQRDLAPLYVEILEAWLQERGESSFAPDGQLVLQIVSGLLTLSVQNEAIAEAKVGQWWRACPGRVRLSWLLEAIELLSLFVTRKYQMRSLWMEGAELIKSDPSTVASGELKLWEQVGQRLDLTPAMIADYLNAARQALPLDDPLVAAPLRRIAVVSLHEKIARTAAEALRARTGAKVTVVPSPAPEETIQEALQADLILFVWAATSYAVLEKFESVKPKLEFVQGTGSASIVRAAERWASRLSRSAEPFH